MVTGGLEATEQCPFANAEHLGDLAAGQFAVLLKFPRTLGHAGLPDDRRPPDRNRIGFTLLREGFVPLVSVLWPGEDHAETAGH